MMMMMFANNDVDEPMVCWVAGALLVLDLSKCPLINISMHVMSTVLVVVVLVSTLQRVLQQRPTRAQDQKVLAKKSNTENIRTFSKFLQGIFNTLKIAH